jgi:hypothetical protein
LAPLPPIGEHRRVTDEKNPADRALELFVFAPLGLVLSARELLPELVERGRQQVNGQVSMARMIGQFAVKQGTVEAEKAFERARASARPRSSSWACCPTSRPPRRRRRCRPRRRPGRLRRRRRPPERSPPTSRSRTGRSPAPARRLPSLAIPDYDSLSASQVLPRLSGLSPAELEAVRAHEATHRGRKTILSKVAQLQAS